MRKCFDTVLDRETGAAVQNATVRMRNAGGTYQTLYADDGITPVTGIDYVLTDENGLFEFYLDDGIYTLWIQADSEAAAIEVDGVEIVDETISAGQFVASTRDIIAAIATPSTTKAATLTETGYEGLWVFSSANLSAQVTADPSRLRYIAPDSASTGSAGAWVKRADAAMADFADEEGADLVGFTRPETGAVESTLQDELRRTIWVENFGAVGDGVTDDAAAIQAADDAAHLIGGTVHFMAKTYLIGDTIDKSWKTTWEGSGFPCPAGPLVTPAARASGTQIYKATNNDGVRTIGAAGYDESGGIRGISMTSDRAVYTTGDGWVFDKVGSHVVEFCHAWGIAGNGFQIGETLATDVTGHFLIRHCQTNDTGGSCFYVRGKWVRINQCISDGGTHGLYLLDALETHIIDCHFEGFTTAGVRFDGGSGSTHFIGKNVIANTHAAATGILIDNDAGNSLIGIDRVKLIGPSVTTAITFTGALVAATSATLTVAWAGATGTYNIYFSDGSIKSVTLTASSTAVTWTGAVTATANAKALSNATSVGIDMQGSAALGSWVQHCDIQYWGTGLKINGATDAEGLYNTFYACGLGVYVAANGTMLIGNKFDTTTSLRDIEHISGTTGLWQGNKMSTSILATSTGTAGNFGGICVKNNAGYVSRNSGSTGNVATGTAVSHGLAGAPAPDIILTAYTAGVTSPYISASSSTTFTLAFTAAGNANHAWMARLPCDF